MRNIMAVAALLGATLCGARADITPDQAAEAVRRFMGERDVQLVYRGASSRAIQQFHGPCYEIGLRHDPGTDVTYLVRVSDGVVVDMGVLRPEDAPDDGFEAETGVPKLVPVSLTEAEANARAFAREHYAGFDGREWAPFPEQAGLDRRGWEYAFEWFEVLSDAGALAPWPLKVQVSGYTGSVVHYCRPPDRPVLAPVRPRITRSQALRIAQRFATLGPDAEPFKMCWLEVVEDVLGVQWLAWHIRERNGVLLMVDAVTGDLLARIVPMGGGGASGPSMPTPRKRVRLQVRVGGASGKPIGSFVPPAMNARALWLRAEHLRAVEGVRVDVDRKAVSVRLGDRVISGTELGARYRDYGWWVPLRQAARVLGWRVEWLNAKKEAVIYTR